MMLDALRRDTINGISMKWTLMPPCASVCTIRTIVIVLPSWPSAPHVKYHCKAPWPPADQHSCHASCHALMNLAPTYYSQSVKRTVFPLGPILYLPCFFKYLGYGIASHYPRYLVCDQVLLTSAVCGLGASIFVFEYSLDGIFQRHWRSHLTS